MKINEKQFQEFRRLIYNSSGINLEGREQLVETRLARRFRKTGPMTVDEYIQKLKTDSLELSSFIDIIATTHTYFFRESKPFAHLDGDNCRSIWCAACSSGEEPYSIMIHCLENGFSPYVLGSDISGEALKTAAAGIYTGDQLRHTPRPLVEKYFILEPAAGEEYYRIKPRVKNKVVFEQSNLVSDDIPERCFDVVFCRNLMIYFDLVTKNRLLEKMYHALRPGGYFIIGGAESLSIASHRFILVSPSVYRKP